MDCNSTTVGQMKLDTIVDAVSAIYANNDSRRSLWDVWCHALHHCAAVAEEVRKQTLPEANDVKLRQEIADFSLWFFTMLARLKGPIGSPKQSDEVPQDWVVRITVNLDDLMWNRYPGVCPWCYCATHADDSLEIDAQSFRQSCTCDALNIAARKKDRIELHARAKRTRRLAAANKLRRPLYFDDWQSLVASLYTERLKRASLSEIALHLLEEMGEVSDGLIRMYAYRTDEVIEDEIGIRQLRLEDELADVLSWLLGLVDRLGLQDQKRSTEYTSESPRELPESRMLLSQILWARYGSNEKGSFWCRYCQKVVCECPIVLLQRKEQVQELLVKLSGPASDGSR